MFFEPDLFIFFKTMVVRMLVQKIQSEAKKKKKKKNWNVNEYEIYYEKFPS